MTKSPEKGSLAELRELMKDMGIVMLTTVAPDGTLHARPMAVQIPEEMPECDFWFVTRRDTVKVDEIQADHQVGVAGYHKNGSYITVSARAIVQGDPVQVKRLWKPDWKAWMPEGPDDPNIVFLKFSIVRAEYWVPEGGRLRVMLGMVKALATGQDADENLPPPKVL
jgi:general stress protein 26